MMPTLDATQMLSVSADRDGTVFSKNGLFLFTENSGLNLHILENGQKCL